MKLLLNDTVKITATGSTGVIVKIVGNLAVVKLPNGKTVPVPMGDLELIERN